MNFRRTGKWLSVVALAGLAAATALLFASEDFRWRATVVAEKATGNIAAIGWSELLPMLLPGSAVRVEQLAATPNAHAVIRNPYKSASDRRGGAQTFVSLCSGCHGVNGEGETALGSGYPRRAGIRALDAMTGRVVWEQGSRAPERDSLRIGGTLATAGNLVSLAIPRISQRSTPRMEVSCGA